MTDVMPSIVDTGLVSVCRTLMVSGIRAGRNSSGSVPPNNDGAMGESPLRPIRVARGPEPNGGLTAWWYCCMLIVFARWAISSGLVNKSNGPFQVLGSCTQPRLGPLACSSGTSTQRRLRFTIGDRVCPNLRYMDLMYSLLQSRHNCFIIQSCFMWVNSGEDREGEWWGRIASAKLSKYDALSCLWLAWCSYMSLYAWRSDVTSSSSDEGAGTLESWGPLKASEVFSTSWTFSMEHAFSYHLVQILIGISVIHNPFACICSFLQVIKFSVDIVVGKLIS